MIINPIIPIWLMAIICIALVVFFRPREKRKVFSQIIILILLFTINLRIMKESENVVYVDNNIDVMFVIDTTLSMVAEDYNGNYTRLYGVKKDCEYIIDKIPGAKFSVITFNNAANLIVPSTQDTNMVLTSVKTVDVLEELYARGSSLNSPMEIMKMNLEKSDPERKQVVFFISDGEITSDEKLESYSELKQYIDSGAVLGYGTSSGGKMKVKSTFYSNTAEYLQDKSNWPYVEAVSKIDESNLNKIADDLGIEYINMNKQSNINQKIKEINNNVFTSTDTDQRGVSHADTYYFVSGILCIVLLIEFIDFKRRV